jgi:periplasmic protein TonB
LIDVIIALSHIFKKINMHFITPTLAILISGFTLSAFAQKQDTVIITTSPGVYQEDKVFTKVDIPAEFPGGVQGWTEYLQKNLRYPNKAFKKGIQGVVKVQFVVDREGNILEVVALNDPGGGLAEESVRIIKNGPKWKPAEQNGRRVIYRHIQAITFKLE